LTKEIPTQKGIPVIVDDDIYDWLIGMGKWTAIQISRKMYAQRWFNEKIVFMHRLILPGADIIDHINGNGMDNRLQNLRSVTNSQNMLNPTNATPTNNTSGRRGVYYDKSKSKWIAAIAIRGKVKYLGQFYQYDAAVAAREDFDQKLKIPGFLEAL
jgi:hypothetical protein